MSREESRGSPDPLDHDAVGKLDSIYATGAS